MFIYKNKGKQKMLSSLFILLIFVKLLHGYENLALNKSARQSSSYSYNKWQAGAAVDGSRNPDHQQNHCAISNDRQTTATWRVDLGKIYSLHNIDIYYRTDIWQYETIFRWRFAGFSLYVSNTTSKEDGYLCFHDGLQNTTTYLPANMSINCMVHGRYVIFYNERRNDINYPDTYSKSAYSELCELEVYGCEIFGTYGEYCNMPCPVNCQEHRCNIVNGICLGCVDGHHGQFCEKTCVNLMYGPQCSLQCGNCVNGEACNHINGVCENGCAAGWHGDKCDKACVNLMYGPQCSLQCGNCVNGEACNHINGACENGCAAGWHGDKCDKACVNLMYGPQCSLQCGNCVNDEACNHKNGACDNGCAAGWHGDKCAKVCADTLYGKDCGFNCSSECLNRTCNAQTGACHTVVKKGLEVHKCEQPTITVLLAVLSATLFLCVIVLAALLFRSKRRNDNIYENTEKQITECTYDNMERPHCQNIYEETETSH